MGQYSCERNSEKKHERISDELSGELDEKSIIEALEELKERREIEEHYVKSTIDWDELPDSVVLYVDRDELIKLVIEVEYIVGKRGGIMSEPFLRSITYGDKDTITVGKLKVLLDIVGIPHDEMDNFICGIGSPGSMYSISNPRLPFDFNSEAGAVVLAAALKDGTLQDRGEQGCWFAYYNKDRENRDRVKEAVSKVFGYIEPHENEERGEISYHNRAIVSTLEKMGVPVGEKVGQDYHVPKVIKEGDENIKRAYLRQTMMDEGTWAYRGFRYTQAAILNLDELSEDDRKYLDEHLSKEKTYPKGDIFHYAYLSKDLKDDIQKKHPEVWEVIEKSKPSFLEEELDMLEEICGLKLELKPRDIYTTTKGEYRVSWCIETSKKEEYNTILERLGLPKNKHRHEG